ncbi:hypothetical protein [Pseudorhodobacter ferrugineus]|uniref:hypothetical protein n=1 Tax=Pseudorhodobacter ferrugineus TaxID=77008 RepID=UPI0003B73C4A|nr:hypothetical protein [Pseudorhodobacter ferrugineus]
MQDSDLDDLFGAARAPVAVPSALMARVLADADAMQFSGRPVVRVSRGTGLWAGFWAAIGGVAGVAGLSTAAVAGVWIGFAQPTALTAVTDAFLTGDLVTDTFDVFPDFDAFLVEG